MSDNSDCDNKPQFTLSRQGVNSTVVETWKHRFASSLTVAQGEIFEFEKRFFFSLFSNVWSNGSTGRTEQAERFADCGTGDDNRRVHTVGYEGNGAGSTFVEQVGT